MPTCSCNCSNVISPSSVFVLTYVATAARRMSRLISRIKNGTRTKCKQPTKCIRYVLFWKTLILQFYVNCTKKVFSHLQVCAIYLVNYYISKLAHESKLFLCSQHKIVKSKFLDKNYRNSIWSSWKWRWIHWTIGIPR